MRNRNKFHLIELCMFAAFYVGFAIVDDPVICADTITYLNMDMSREPLYCIWLAMFNSLSAAVVGQGIVTALCNWSLYSFLCTRYVDGLVNSRVSRVAVHACMMLIILGPSLLNRFVATRGSMYFNSLISEALAIPLFLLFIRFLLDYVTDDKSTGMYRPSLLICSILSVVLISTRKQMYITLLLLFAGIIIRNRELRKSIENKKPSLAIAVLTIGIVMVSVIGSAKLIDLTYNKQVRGEWVTHSGDIRFLATVAFYVADESDAQLFDSGAAELFTDIYTTCRDQGYNCDKTLSGWRQRVSHYSGNYDHIQIDIMWNRINHYILEQETADDNGVYLNTLADSYMREFAIRLIPRHIGRALQCYFDEFLAGLELSVARDGRIYDFYSVCVYLGYGLCMWFLNRTKKREGRDDIAPYFSLGLIVLISIVANSVLVSAVIFCQTRYMIYNMPLFYLAFFIMGIKLYKLRVKYVNEDN